MPYYYTVVEQKHWTYSAEKTIKHKTSHNYFWHKRSENLNEEYI